jgi:hypothetical protein
VHIFCNKHAKLRRIAPEHAANERWRDKRGDGVRGRAVDFAAPSANAAAGLAVSGVGFAVMLGVVLARLGGVMNSMRRMAMRGMCMVGRGLVRVGVVMLGRFAMVLGRMLVMLGGSLVMINDLLLGHGDLLGERMARTLTGHPRQI